MAKAKKQKLNESLKGLDLNGSILKGRDFSNFDLTDTDFRGSDIRDCILSGSVLGSSHRGKGGSCQFTSFYQSRFFGVKFHQSDMDSVFNSSYFYDCTFHSADIDGDFMGTSFHCVNFSNCDFGNRGNFTLSSTVFKDVLFEECFFSSTSFSDSFLLNANFKECSFKFWNPANRDDPDLDDDNYLILQSTGDFPVFQVPAFGKYFPGCTFYITTKGIFVGDFCPLVLDEWLEDAAGRFGEVWEIASSEWNLAVQLVRAHALANQ